jgi:tetratricopeptide (TPR) repeat protein
MNEAIQFSKEERIFYRIDDLYRLACYQSIINENAEDRVYYLKKLRQYGEFAENKSSISIAAMLDAHFYNSFSHDYQKAFESAELFLELSIEVDSEQIRNDNSNHYLLEKGKALFGLGSVKEALALLEDYIVPSYLHHPYDLSMAYEVHSYRALCYAHLGEKEKAFHEAKIGYDLIIQLPDTPYKTFIVQTYLDLQKSSDLT